MDRARRADGRHHDYRGAFLIKQYGVDNNGMFARATTD